MGTANGSAGTGTSQALLAAAEKMVPEIRASSAEAEAARRLPDALAAKLDEAGFFRMTLGRESGGLEVDPLTAAKVVEILSTASPSVGWVVMIIASSLFWVARVLPEEARDEVFPAGTVANIAGTVVPHGRLSVSRAAGGFPDSGPLVAVVTKRPGWPAALGCMMAMTRCTPPKAVRNGGCSWSLRATARFWTLDTPADCEEPAAMISWSTAFSFPTGECFPTPCWERRCARNATTPFLA